MSGALVTAAIFDTREERDVTASMLRAYGIHVVVPTVTVRTQGYLLHVPDRDLEVARALIAEAGSTAHMPDVGCAPDQADPVIGPVRPAAAPSARLRSAAPREHGFARLLIAVAIVGLLCAAIYAALIIAGLDGSLVCLLLADPAGACS